MLSVILALSTIVSVSTANQSTVGSSGCAEPRSPAVFEQCNLVATGAFEQCEKVKNKESLCGSAPSLAGMDQAQSQNAMKDYHIKCEATVREEQRACNVAAQNSIDACKAAEAAAQADRNSGNCKVGEGQGFQRAADAKERSASQSTPALAAEVQNLRNRGEGKISEGNQQVEQAESIAGTARDMVEHVAKLRSEANSEAEKQKAAIQRGSDVVTNLEKAHGSGKPNSDRANGQQRESGNPSSSPGQAGDQAGQQKKQDEGGGGGSPGGGGGSPSSSASSNPLKVSDPPQDCSNPSVAASNPVCACRLNPTDSRCNSILAADKERREGIAKKQKVLSGETEGGGGGFSTGGGGYPDVKSPKNISQHGQLQQNAGGSAGKGVGSGQGGGAQGNSKNDAKALPYRDQTMAKGGRGGGGGGGAGFGGGSAQNPNSKIPSTFAGAKVGNKGRQPASVKSQADMRAQMQAQFNARRNPAGVVGPDGITGKHTDQFKKIRTRYADIMGF